MSYLLGAINKDTNNYENIVSVQKPNQYKCCWCGLDLILRKGEKNFQSFIHKNPNGCEYFKNPTTEQLLFDAKLFLKKLLETNKVDFIGKCKICKFNLKIVIPEYDETKSVRIDYAFNNDLIDLVYLDSEQKIICGIEVYNGVPTKQIEEYLFFQINMLELVHSQTTCYATGKLELKCGKRELCRQCVKYDGVNNF
jgi:hypothetical protein